MSRIQKNELIKNLCPPFDIFLTTQLVDEFISLEKRYIQRDWEPAQLDGGQFCEVLARILYHQDSGNLNLSKPFSECNDYIENNSVSHAVTPRHDLIHLVKVSQVVYKFRSQRGSVHISPTYSPNHMDAKWMIESVRWCFNEVLRIFWNSDREEVAKAICEILVFDVPAIGKYDDILIVQRTDLSCEQEIVMLLHYAGDDGLSRTQIGKYMQSSPSTITNNLQKLVGSSKRQVIQKKNGNYMLTELGAKVVREELAEKLLI